jgi:hypothetical protein
MQGVSVSVTATFLWFGVHDIPDDRSRPLNDMHVFNSHQLRTATPKLAQRFRLSRKSLRSVSA